MKKVKSLKGFIIAETTEKERIEGKNNFELFLKDEWECGKGFRNAEFDCGSLQESIDFINCY